MLAIVYTMEEVQGILACEEDTVRTLIQTGKIAAIKAARSWIFPRAAFDARLNEWATDEAEFKRAEAKRRAAPIFRVSQPIPIPSAGRRRIPPTLQAYST